MNGSLIFSKLIQILGIHSHYDTRAMGWILKNWNSHLKKKDRYLHFLANIFFRAL